MTSRCMNFAFIIPWIYFTIWEKIKQNCHHYNTIFSFYNIKTLQEELAKKSNIPWIWRIIYRHKLPYMKKTRKKKQVCGAACFMAAEIKFSKDVRHTFLTMFLSLYHPEIFRNYYHWQTQCPCKRSRSKVKVTEVMTPFSHFQTVTPVCFHIWWWNDAQSLMLLRRVPYCSSRSSVKFQGHTAKKNCRFWPKLAVSRLYLQFEFTIGYEMMHKGWSSIGEVSYCFSRSCINFQSHAGQKNC